MFHRITVLVGVLGFLAGCTDYQDEQANARRVQEAQIDASAEALENAASIESAMDIIEKRALQVPAYDPDQQ